MSEERTSQDIAASTCSPASAGGTMRYNSPGGPQIELSGLEAAPVSPSPLQGNDVAPKTNATCGPTCSDSSASVVLQSSLESRLQARMDVNGSPEYVLTWKHWDMPSGPPICALRASVRRTSGSACSGWPTPRTLTGGGESAKRKQELGRTASGGGDLQAAAQTFGWQTPTTNPENHMKHINGTPNLAGQARLFGLLGWVTPIAGTSSSRRSIPGRQSTPLKQAAEMVGYHSRYFAAQTPLRGVLNPEFCRWLMGYPAVWQRHAPGWQAWARFQQALSAKQASTKQAP